MEASTCMHIVSQCICRRWSAAFACTRPLLCDPFEVSAVHSSQRSRSIGTTGPCARRPPQPQALHRAPSIRWSQVPLEYPEPKTPSLTERNPDLESSHGIASAPQHRSDSVHARPSIRAVAAGRPDLGSGGLLRGDQLRRRDPRQALLLDPVRAAPHSPTAAAKPTVRSAAAEGTGPYARGGAPRTAPQQERTVGVPLPPSAYAEAPSR
jgi:hypothetical protein